MKRIYFDNASTTQIDKDVVDVMTATIKDTYGNPSSIHHHGRVARALIEEARKKVANSIKASIGEIFFTSSATEANNMVLKNAVVHLGVKHIISSPTEHHCIFHTLDYLKETQGIKITYLEVDSKGNPDLEQLENLVENKKEKTLVSLMYGNNEIGTMINIDEVSNICKAADVYFHSDTVQALGKIPIDVNKTYLSFMSGAAHKFHGPKGVGFLYMNLDNIIPPYLHGGAQERNMRAGTENVYGIVGMAKALEIATNNMSEYMGHVQKLRSHFIKRVQNELADVHINGNEKENFLPHVLSLSFPNTERADMLMFNLDISGICVSSGSACSSGIETDSHVLIAIGHDPKRKTIRFSFSKYNTIQEVDYVVEKLKTLTPLKIS